MSRWLATLPGRGPVVLEEYDVSEHATETEARAAALELGAVLRKERIQGAIYSTDDGRFFRVSSRGWAPGYVLIGTREVRR